MNPATLLLEKLQLTGLSTSADWRFIHCVLDTISKNDDRAFRNTEYTNWVDDVIARIKEAGVEEDTGALLIIRQLLAPTRELLLKGN